MLREAKGNMYGFVTHTFNVIKGKCIHNCNYCYMKEMPLKDLRIDKKQFNADLGINNFIFIGSSTDMFANNINDEWIIEVLNYCKRFNNKYLFQSKNPAKMWKLKDYFPINSVICTTIETNRIYAEMGGTPTPLERARVLGVFHNYNFETMVTIEPIMDFDLEELVDLIRISGAKQVNIGADSKNHNLPEPPKEKILQLIKELSKFTTIINKENLIRLMEK